MLTHADFYVVRLYLHLLTEAIRCQWVETSIQNSYNSIFELKEQKEEGGAAVHTEESLLEVRGRWAET